MTDDFLPESQRWLNDQQPSPRDNPERIHTEELQAIYTTPGEPRSSFAHPEGKTTGIEEWALEKEWTERGGRVLRTILALSVGSILLSGVAVIAALWIWGGDR